MVALAQNTTVHYTLSLVRGNLRGSWSGYSGNELMRMPLHVFGTVFRRFWPQNGALGEGMSEEHMP